MRIGQINVTRLTRRTESLSRKMNASREVTQGPERILHVFASLDRGGAEQLVMSWFRQMNRSTLQFDFVAAPREEQYAHVAEIQARGGKVFYMARPTPNLFKSAYEWLVLLRSHPEWRTLHVHHASTSVLFVPTARLLGRRVIVHSHTSNSDGRIKTFVKRLTQWPLRYLANDLIACSETAGRWMFGKHAFRVISNAIDVQAFRFNSDLRAKRRLEMGLRDRPVLVHTGNFTSPKNHRFLVQVAAEVMTRHYPNAFLVLIGDGPLREEVEEFVSELGLEAKVYFAGAVDNVQEFLNASDVFVFPSVYEGLPISVVEAQANGLPCIISDAVTAEVVLTNGVTSLPLSLGVEAWAKEVAAAIANSDLAVRDTTPMLRGGPFDVSASLEEALSLYEHGNSTWASIAH